MIAWKLYQIQQFVSPALRNTQELLKLLTRSENSHTLPKMDTGSPSAGLWGIQGCVPILPACVSGGKTGGPAHCRHAKSSLEEMEGLRYWGGRASSNSGRARVWKEISAARLNRNLCIIWSGNPGFLGGFRGGSVQDLGMLFYQSAEYFHVETSSFD